MRTERTFVGQSEPYLADVSSATFRARLDTLAIHSLGTRDEARRVFLGCVVADNVFADVPVPTL